MVWDWEVDGRPGVRAVSVRSVNSSTRIGYGGMKELYGVPGGMVG